MTEHPDPGRPRRRGRPAGPGMKAAVLRAARQLFGEVGYERTAIRDVARRAGVTHPTVTHHFSDKPTLYGSILASAVDDMATVGRATASSQEDPRRKIEAFLRAGVAFDDEDRSITRFVTGSLLDSFRYPELHGSADAQLDEVRGFLRTVLVDGTRSGALRGDLDVEATVEMLVATMWGMALYAAFIGDREQLETAADQFGRLLRGTLW